MKRARPIEPEGVLVQIRYLYHLIDGGCEPNRCEILMLAHLVQQLAEMAGLDTAVPRH
jgi:hypothetical protein